MRIVVNKKYEQIQVMGTSWGIYHLLQYDIHRNLPVSIKNSIILFSCIFESSVMIWYCIWAATWDFQQCGILTSVDSVKPVQSPFKLRNSKWFRSVDQHSENMRGTSKGSDQTVRMHRLVWGFAGCIYHIVGNPTSQLISFVYLHDRLLPYDERESTAPHNSYVMNVV